MTLTENLKKSQVFTNISVENSCFLQRFLDWNISLPNIFNKIVFVKYKLE